jgi:hypothetical protein
MGREDLLICAAKTNDRVNVAKVVSLFRPNSLDRCQASGCAPLCGRYSGGNSPHHLHLRGELFFFWHGATLHCVVAQQKTAVARINRFEPVWKNFSDKLRMIFLSMLV